MEVLSRDRSHCGDRNGRQARASTHARPVHHSKLPDLPCYLAICCSAVIQFSTWYAEASLPFFTVKISIAIVLKLLPVGLAPQNSPVGVPVALPRTTIW